MNTTTDPVQLIIDLGSDRPGTVRDALTDYAGRLAEAGCFDGLSVRDARLAVAAIAVDAVPADDPAAVLCARQVAVIVLANL
ncbi:hypothetical protein [Mycolicibacterium hippocampi]|uniref:Uncharacterized protein n=1 Tax=Mycolicibacterium hippocampi TaxID=659824 RepID=A0A7I9ZG59_9MYCO|nr:hypothetical protein [Mycolicibacterium hippocampi]GFH00005.1 hypothetical protein MHIP_04880 [Mycolicibacterium hippocampi]